jgi:hypothetical protein
VSTKQVWSHVVLDVVTKKASEEKRHVGSVLFFFHSNLQLLCFLSLLGLLLLLQFKGFELGWSDSAGMCLKTCETYSNVFPLETLEINDCSRQGELELVYVVPGRESDGDFVTGLLETK